MASLQTEDTLPGGLRFLTLQHAYEVAKARAAASVVSASFKTAASLASQAVVATAAAEEETETETETALATESKENDDDEEEARKKSGLEPLEDGHQKLYSYFLPRLDGGRQTITTTQTIVASGADANQGVFEPKMTTKPFIVQAPQFALPDNCVLSVNPAPGGLAAAETLPHVVFKDPHLPWERRVNSGEDADAVAARRERMPWLALLVFSQAELQLEPELLQGDGSAFAATSLAKDAQGKPVVIKQSSDFALTLSPADVNVLNGQGSIISPIPQPDDPSSKTTAIFLKPKLFQQLVTTYEQKEITDEDGKKLVLPSPKEGQAAADISRFKYFAHVRHVKTAGMTASAQYKEGLFSVIMSHRAGPLSTDQKTPAVVHLVSLEGWKDMPFPLPGTAQRVAVSSLYSWTYTALPTGGVSLEAEFKNLGKDIGLLRAPPALVAKMEAADDPKLAAKLGKRLREGYTMQRHRTRTGEVTSCFFRAALVPVVPATPTWTAMSRCGSDLQILDRGTGIMDITYSAAWQLGKALAIADTVFTTALTRLWNAVYGICLDGAKQEVLSEQNAYKSRKDVLQSFKTSIMTLNEMQRQRKRPSTRGGQSEGGWHQETPSARRPFTEEAVSLVADDAAIREKSEEQAKRYIRKLAGAKDEDGKEYSDGERFYNELNSCVSAEWKIILTWIMDRLHLFGVPPAYLIADPSFLPQESIRFFHIDPNWLDALIDGALSLGSHMDKNDDYIRRRIKGAINTYLETTDPATGFRPQTPSYGMMVRSDLVSRFPDLKVEAPIPLDAPEAGRAPILRQEMIGDGLLLCLFDRTPGLDHEMPVLALTQPPHQQTFALGHRLTPDSLAMRYNRTYTVKRNRYEFAGAMPERTTERSREASGSVSESGPPLFLWGDADKGEEARFLLTDAWARDVVALLQHEMPLDFTDTAMTSAVAAFQLGMPIYRFIIGNTKSLQDLQPDPTRPPRPRGLQMLDPMQVDSQQAAAVAEATTTLALQGMAHSASPLITVKNLETGPPPHFRRTPTLTLIRTPSAAAMMTQAASMASSETASAPRFKFGVHAIGAPDGPLRTGKGPLDLVFTIKRSDDASLDKNYWLKCITLEVPRGSKDDDSHAPLLENYRGPGPTMLSNLRFNVFIEKDVDKLILTVRPRSRKGRHEGVLIKRIRECGFVLPLVEVHDVEREVKITRTVEWAEPLETIPPYPFPVELQPAGP
ncbi:hypothetical protein EDB81DRAFT_863055 [Dactylonectria macrodidyma]|uniref:Uncharacterized protein n=1 Tax=Dactylonectria macrodidyma TaxID=307937 RepID=A0A9P9D172_9HYPO|nr:hypothetical protein EDB81DRAFT_863055 [Dactylonectria macrodidyma]